jgi:hypothetical protein
VEEKVKAILAIRTPTTIAELRSFVGSVNFYRDMFRPRSHLLAPLTSQSGNRKLKWNAECQSAFDQVKALLAQETLLQYPDHNKPFHIYTDARSNGVRSHATEKTSRVFLSQTHLRPT